MTNGEQALEYLYRKARISRKLLPGLIISDISMPVMDGIEMLKALRYLDYTREIPVVMYSSSVLESNKQICRDLGILDYLSKPLSIKDLERILLQLKNGRNRTGTIDTTDNSSAFMAAIAAA
jgi:CheY-like chemotaxis protein